MSNIADSAAITYKQVNLIEIDKAGMQNVENFSIAYW